jgi:branched-chain amino acid transport system substrate-binding protein
MAFPIHSRHTRRSALQLVGATGLTMVGLPATMSRAALDAIHVAVVVDTSGAGGVYGAPVLKGMLLAATEINARGGVNGHALDLTVSDGRSDLARVTALVRRACHDTTMVALVGPTLSSEAVKVDPLAQAAGLPVLAVSNTVPGLTAIGPYIFRITLGDAQIIPVVLKTAQASLHFQKVALLYDAVNAATAAAGRIFGAVAARMGLTIVATQTFASGATHFGTPLATLKAARPDALLVSALAQDAVRILTQRLQVGMPARIPIIGANGLNTAALIRGAGVAAEGVIVGTAYDPSGPSARNRHFRAAYVHRYGHPPDVFAAQGYDGIYALATALRHAHTTRDRQALRAALAALQDVPAVLSATGHFSFSANREANLVPTVRIVRHGRFVRFP